MAEDQNGKPVTGPSTLGLPSLGDRFSVPPRLGLMPPMRPPPGIVPPLHMLPGAPGGSGSNAPNQLVPNFRLPPFVPPMMQARPPLGNTVVPKPPTIDKEGQMWLEACSAEGKVYYFNAKTRETRWTKPETVTDLHMDRSQPGSSMLNRTEADDKPTNLDQTGERLSDANSLLNKSDIGNRFDDNDPYDDMDTNDLDELVRNSRYSREAAKSEESDVSSPEDGVVEDADDKNESPADEKRSPFKDSQPPTAQPVVQFPNIDAERMSALPVGLRFPLALPGMPIFHPGLPMPAGLPPLGRPPFGIPPMPFPPRLPPGSSAVSLPGMPPGLRFPPPMPFRPTTIGDWTQHRLPDGRFYYHNNLTKESRWEKPLEFAEESKPDDNTPLADDAKKEEVKPVKDEIVKKEDDKPKDKDEGGEEQAPKGKSKPVANRLIPGSGWHLVWTGDGRVFFYNPTSKTSIWERPTELEGNAVVDDILKSGPASDKKELKIDDEKVKETKDGENLEMKKEGGSTRLDYKPLEILLDAGSIAISENEPAVKKQRLEEGETLENLAGVRAEEMKVSEEDAERERLNREAAVKKEIVPLDERMAIFMELLREKEVSGFSTWDKELHKIVFDPRYLLLSMKERKVCFEKYVKVRVVEERKEKINKTKQMKDDFKALLEEVISSGKISFSDFAGKNSKDSRYKAIDKMRDREVLFNEFMNDFRKHEKEKLKLREEKLRTQFFTLLSELNNLDENAEWKKVKSSIESDKRYELVGSSSKREQFFYEYLKERLLSSTENISDGSPPPPPEDYFSVKPPLPVVDEVFDQIGRQERVEASIRKREEEVRAQKEIYEKERDKERSSHMHDKAVQHFNALLADMVKDYHFTWKETRRSLRKDPRWAALEVLDSTEKETLFNQHVTELRNKRKNQFRKMLDETDIPLDARWKDVKRRIKDDVRYSRFGSSELREEEFDAYMKERISAAQAEFRDLLRETKLINYRTKKSLAQNPGQMKDIVEILKKDKRYLTLESMNRDRDWMLQNYIDELARKGPPPPPTATNPSLRYKKGEP